MPKVTVYIRNEDIDEWRSIGAKTTFVHNALKQLKDSGIEALGLIVDDRVQVTTLDKPLVRMDKGMDTYTKKIISDGTVAIGEFPDGTTGIKKSRLKNGLCKIHGTPLDSRGKCLQKNCRYA